MTLPETPSSPARPETWSTRMLLKWMTSRFEQRRIDSPRVVAELLLSHVLGCDRMRLYMEVDRTASPAELQLLRDMVARAQDDEPVQYIVGRSWFFGREFEVDRSTQIPQPCTEDLVSAVLDWHRGRSSEGQAAQPLRVADVGTGSGIIAVSLALGIPGATVLAVDIEPTALDLAQRNVERHGVTDRVELVQGDGCAPLKERGEPFDVICSNPPYVPDHEWDGGLVQASVRNHTPPRALRGGADGLDVIRPLIQDAAALLAPGGLLAVEIADAQRDAVVALAERAGLHKVEVLKDGEGYWRVLCALAS